MVGECGQDRPRLPTPTSINWFELGGVFSPTEGASCGAGEGWSTSMGDSSRRGAPSACPASDWGGGRGTGDGFRGPGPPPPRDPSPPSYPPFAPPGAAGGAPRCSGSFWGGRGGDWERREEEEEEEEKQQVRDGMKRRKEGGAGGEGSEDEEG